MYTKKLIESLHKLVWGMCNLMRKNLYAREAFFEKCVTYLKLNVYLDPSRQETTCMWTEVSHILNIRLFLCHWSLVSFVKIFGFFETLQTIMFHVSNVLNTNKSVI